MSVLITKLILFVHGIVGGSILLMMEKTRSYILSVKLLVISGICSVVLTPAIAHHWTLSYAATSATALLLGVAAWKLMIGFIRILNSFSKDPISILKLWRKP